MVMTVLQVDEAKIMLFGSRGFRAIFSGAAVRPSAGGQAA
jgi:hypothetical protein